MSDEERAKRLTEAAGAWVDQTALQIGTRPVLTLEGDILIDLSKGRGPNLGGAPTNWPIRIINPGTDRLNETIYVGGHFRRLTVDCSNGLDALIVQGGEVDQLDIRGLDGRSTNLTLALQVDRLILTRGSFVLVDWNGRSIQLATTELKPVYTLNVSELLVHDTATLGDQQVVADRCVVTPVVEINSASGSATTLGAITSTTGEAPELILNGNAFDISSVPDGTRFKMTIGQLFLGSPQLGRETEVPRDLILMGSTALTLKCHLENPTFVGQLLHVESTIAITSARGAAGLQSCHGLIQGAEQTPLALTGVQNVSGAELENVSLYDLRTVGDAVRLREAARLIPWFPHAGEARKNELDMTFGTRDEATRKRRAMSFWARIDEALTSQHAPGSIQSQVRLAEARARRRALSWRHDTRERLLLTLFSFVGYGERVSFPLAVWAGTVCIAGVLLYVTNNAPGVEHLWSGEFVKLLGRLAAAPLALLRLEGFRHRDVPGPWDTIFWTTAQAVGVVCAIFALLAIRRVTRPGAPP